MASRQDISGNRLDDAARAGWLYYVAGNNQEEIARKLGMSERSLRRRLATAGISFHDVLHEARAARATSLLARAGATVDSVARALGFTSSYAFQRAFKRWSGKRAKDVLTNRHRGPR